MTMVEIIAIITTGILCVLCVVCIITLIGSQRQAKANSKAIKDIENSLSSFGDSIKAKTDQLIDHMDRQQVDELQTQRLELLEQEVLRLSELEKKTKEMESEQADIPDASSQVSAPDGIYMPDEIEEAEIEEIEEIDDEIELDDIFRELEAMGAEEAEKPAELQQRQEPEPDPPQQAVPATPVPQQAAPAPQQPAAPPLQPQEFTSDQLYAQMEQLMREQIQLQAAPPPPQPAPPRQPQPAPAPPEPAPEPTRYHQGYNIGRSGKKYTAEELNMLIRE